MIKKYEEENTPAPAEDKPAEDKPMDVSIAANTPTKEDIEAAEKAERHRKERAELAAKQAKEK